MPCNDRLATTTESIQNLNNLYYKAFNDYKRIVQNMKRIIKSNTVTNTANEVLLYFISSDMTRLYILFDINRVKSNYNFSYEYNEVLNKCYESLKDDKKAFLKQNVEEKLSNYSIMTVDFLTETIDINYVKLQTLFTFFEACKNSTNTALNKLKELSNSLKFLINKLNRNNFTFFRTYRLRKLLKNQAYTDKHFNQMKELNRVLDDCTVITRKEMIDRISLEFKSLLNEKLGMEINFTFNEIPEYFDLVLSSKGAMYYVE